VRLVVELLVNPRETMMDHLDLVRLLGKVLDCSIQRIEEIPKILTILDPNWEVTYEDLKSLAVKLHSFSNQT
jgi:hypothetical protein